jgi:hypothetical protein
VVDHGKLGCSYEWSSSRKIIEVNQSAGAQTHFVVAPYKTKNTELEAIPTFETEFDGRNIKELIIKSLGNTGGTTKILFGHNEVYLVTMKKKLNK